MNYSFNVEMAMKYGLNGAIILQNLAFWQMKNAANKHNFFEGHYWTYNTQDAFKEMFPFLTAHQIRYTLETLVKKNAIKTGCFNKTPLDRTKWYTVIDKNALFSIPKCNREYSQMQSGMFPDDNIDTDSKLTDSKHNSPSIPQRGKGVRDGKSNRFRKPTAAEVDEYCKERRNGITGQEFCDFYEAKGWRIGSNPMKDWKAAVRTWENKRKGAQPQHTKQTSIYKQLA